MKTDSREKLLADVDAYCEELRPSEELCYLEHRYNDQTVELAKKHNLLGMPVPVEYGGRGADAVTYARALYAYRPRGNGSTHVFFRPLEHRSASTRSCALGMPISTVAICRRRSAGKSSPPPLAFGLTGAGRGQQSRLEMTTTYRRDGNRFLLNGVKYLISNGGIADAVVAFGYPEGKSGKDRRMSAFIVDAKGATFEAEDLHAKPGMFTANTGMFQMTDHPVPVENLLGEEGNGFRVAMGTLVSGRLSVAAGCLGVIEDCLAEALQYARSRVQHGKQLGRGPSVGAGASGRD